MRATIFTSLVLLTLLGTALADDVVAIRGGRVIPVSGAEIPEGTVIVRDGRIEAVGRDVEIPWDARVIEAKGRVITPGFVHPHTQGGLDRANESMPVTPFVSVVDSIDPDSVFFKDALRQGITTLLVAPGDETVIGGQAAVVHPVGRYVDEMVVTRDAGMKISVSGRRNVSRMAQMAELRRALDAAVRYREGLDRARAKAKKEGGEAPEVDPRQEAMLRLLAGELPAIIRCERGMDVLAADRVITEYGLDGFLVTGPEAWKAAGAAKEAGLAVVLPSVLEYWDRDELSGEETRRFVAGPWRDAGVPFALATGRESLGARLLWHRAAVLVRNGVPAGDALRAVTLDAAKVIGLADRFGSLEPGKDGDLVVWTGDPLSITTWVETVVIGGKVVYERKKDARLEKLLAAEGEEAAEEGETPEEGDEDGAGGGEER